MRRAVLAALALALLLALPVRAYGPEEVMEDPALQTRAMALYNDLRCVRCRSESIASSNADWARDARGVVRERLRAGDTDREVLAFFRDRYGDYVLMDPPVTVYNLGLWLAGPLLLLLGTGVAVAFVRGRGRQGAAAGHEPVPLSAEEQARLRRLMDESD